MKDSLNTEQRRLELEEKRLVVEEQVKNAELELKRKELEAKLTEASSTPILKSASFSPTTIAAVIGILATLMGYLIQSYLNRELEREKFQGQLILKAIETGDPEKARVNLRFFVETGLLSDSDGNIKAALDRIDKNPKITPVLPNPSQRSIRLYGMVRDEQGNPVANAEVQVVGLELKVITTGSGVFSIDDISAKSDEAVRLRVSKDGYETSEEYVVLGAAPAIILLQRSR